MARASKSLQGMVRYVESIGNSLCLARIFHELTFAFWDLYAAVNVGGYSIRKCGYECRQ